MCRRAGEGSGEEGKLELSIEGWMQFKAERARNIPCLYVSKRYDGIEQRA